nr:hypothetical protein [Tanacetum cinerariifolium]
MFESGSYKSLLKHVALYKALEAYMKRANRDEFLAKKDKSRKRCREDQDPPPPLSDSDPIRKKRHNSDNVNILDSEDTDTIHLPELKTRLDEGGSRGRQTSNSITRLDQVDLANPEGHQIMPEIRKPLPLGGPPALSISKLKAAHYLDFGLEELVISLWIESEREYDISATYDLKRNVRIKGKKKEALHTLRPKPGQYIYYQITLMIAAIKNIRVIPKYHSEDGNPARANIKQVLGRADTAAEETKGITLKGLHKVYDRFQTLMIQLEIHGAGVSHKDVNQKFLRSLPSFCTNDVITAYCISSPYVLKSHKEGSSSYTDEVIHSFFTNQSSAPQLDYDDLEQINDDDMEEMGLKWQVAMISMRIKKFYKKTCRKFQFDTKDPVGFDKTKVECFNCHKLWHFARECRAKGNQDS